MNESNFLYQGLETILLNYNKLNIKKERKKEKQNKKTYSPNLSVKNMCPSSVNAHRTSWLDRKGSKDGSHLCGPKSLI